MGLKQGCVRVCFAFHKVWLLMGGRQKEHEWAEDINQVAKTKQTYRMRHELLAPKDKVYGPSSTDFPKAPIGNTDS